MRWFHKMTFEPTSRGYGDQAKIFFPNGFGVSVLTGGESFSQEYETFEIAVLVGGPDGYEIAQNTAVGDLVAGHLRPEVVDRVISAVSDMADISELMIASGGVE